MKLEKALKRRQYRFVIFQKDCNDPAVSIPMKARGVYQGINEKRKIASALRAPLWAMRYALNLIDALKKNRLVWYSGSNRSVGPGEAKR